MNGNKPDKQGAGLICAFELDGRGGGREIGWEEIGSPEPRGQKRWIHMGLPSRNARNWLEHKTRLDESVIDALLQDESRPRSLQTDEGILIVLRGANLNPDSDAADMVSIRFWIDSSRVISIRKRPLSSVQQIRDDLRAGRGPASPSGFLVQVVSYMGDHISAVIEKLDDEIEKAELTKPGSGSGDHYGTLGRLRRQTAQLRRYLAPQRDALDRLSRLQNDHLSSDVLAELLEETNRTTLFVEELDLARERAMVAREEALSSLAQAQNSKIYVLSLVAAVFLPLSYITGLMGMNVAGLPGTEDPWAFTIVLGSMLLIGTGILALFRWKKWM